VEKEIPDEPHCEIRYVSGADRPTGLRLFRDTQCTLYKAQECDCCEAYAEYPRKNGFDLKIEAVNDLADMSLKAGVPPGFQGCHLIKLNGYLFEGHITSELIKRVVSEKPENIIGISIPGMPSGVPGMEGPKDGPIKVYAIKRDGTTTIYATQ
jgi:hypothetical protein